MTSAPRPEPGSSVEGTRPRDTDARRRWPAVARVAAGIAVAVSVGIGGTAVWAVIGHGAGAEDARTASGRPVAASDDELLRQATERLIGRCMARHGFAYNEQPPDPPWARSFPYVVDDVAWARKYGYGNVPRGRDAEERDANFANLEKLTPDQQEAWHRTLMGSGRQLTVEIPDRGRLSAPDNGCVAEARRTLYRDLAGWYQVRRIVDHLDIYVSDQVIEDSHYRTGLAAWSRCMRRHGYRASSSRELRVLIAKQVADLPPQQARTREIAAAKTEANCAISTRLPKTIRSLERKHRPEIERGFARELEELKAIEREAIPRARQILADS